MKNKIKLKKYLTKTIIISIILIIIFILINIYEYNIYTKNFNTKIIQIINALQEKYPELTENEIVEILNNEENSNNLILKKYSIGINNKSIIKENEKTLNKFLIINILFFSLSFTIIMITFLLYNKKKEKEISEITKYIEEINKKNYELQIDSITEDELSILKNEIYKTTIMLKESAENSNQDKINLKKSLEDISHQLKTPLTSILILLDNLIDDQNMNIETRNDFLTDIKREIININFLVQSILKLSKFDANTIHFIKEKTTLNKIIKEAVKNVSTLCDLRNIKIEINGPEEAKIICDAKWQIEAITNILKNSIEHSQDNHKIVVKYEKNNIYSYIEIQDYGEGISKKDLKHIFERFYKGENASKDSIGIGLALSKTIIEEDNGTISVESNENGTKFTIKYY